MTEQFRPVILAVAPNGARLTKADHPNLPTTPSELADTAAECLDAGASMIHLHVRDAEGRHILDADLFRTATEAVRRAVGDRMVIQATTEAVGRYTAAEQMALVRDLRPEAASMALRELVPDAAAEPGAASFYAWCARERIMVQHILYDADDAARLKHLHATGVIPDGMKSVLFVLGRYRADQQSTPADLIPFLAVKDPAWDWMMCAFGRQEHDCAVAAALLGGHSRIGFENNRTSRNGEPAVGNAGQIAELAATLRGFGRRTAKAEDWRPAP